VIAIEIAGATRGISGARDDVVAIDKPAND
jgi:hypothetical protein